MSEKQTVAEVEAEMEAKRMVEKMKALRQGTRTPEDKVPEQFKIAGTNDPYDVL
jgi:hypothetical protein